MGPEPIKSMFDSINMHEKHKRNTKMIEIIAKNKVLYQKIEDFSKKFKMSWGSKISQQIDPSLFKKNSPGGWR